MSRLPTLFAAALTILSTPSCRTSTRQPRSYLPSRVHAVVSFASLTSKPVLEAAMRYPAPRAGVRQVPLSLTAADGTGLRLVRLEAKAVVQGPLAFTELRLGFHNPEDRQREGRFQVTLPPTAAISRFAMKIRDQWQEAEMVERQAARQIYEDFLHRKQDPALLERKAGNQFRARVFPIAPRSDKEIILSYSERLVASSQPYRLHLSGLPRVARVMLAAHVGAAPAAVSRRTNWAPTDWVVPQRSAIDGLRSQNLALVRVTPDLPSARASMAGLVLLLDTSASRAPGFRRLVRRLGDLLGDLEQRYGPQLPLHLACFDQAVATVYRGAIGELTRQDLDGVLARRPLGASDIHRALRWAGGLRGKDQRLVLVTDGVATAGRVGPASLRAAVRDLGATVRRLDVLLVGGIRDEVTMRRLVVGGLERDGVVLDGDKPMATVAARLARETVSGITVTVPGAQWIWPRRLDGMQAGDQALVFLKLPPAARPVTLDAPLQRAAGQRPFPPRASVRVELGGPVSQRSSNALTDISRALLQRAWAEARIAQLQQEIGANPAGRGRSIRSQIVKLSTKHRVLSDYTAFLVLETEADYVRYDIRREALEDVMVVGRAGTGTAGAGKRSSSRVQTKSVASAHRYRKTTRFAFDDDLVQGELMKPMGEMIESRRKARHSSLVLLPQPPGLLPFLRPEDWFLRPQPARNALRPLPSGKFGVLSPPADPPALTGRLAQVMDLLREGRLEQALVQALTWRAQQPGNVMALVALGEVLQAHGATALAARVYGSIIDLFPSRADMRRFAGERLEGLGPVGLPMAVDSYEKAVDQRPDHGLGHHLLGLALARLGRLDSAMDTLERGLKQHQNRRIHRPGVARVLRDDLGLVAAAAVARRPKRRAQIERRLSRHGVRIANRPGLRFLLSWQTDANDVDLHVHDSRGNHASYSNKTLSSGGELVADVQNGYGPECFVIPGVPQAAPYRLRVHYYSRGPMGYGMGKVQVLSHDGRGELRFSDRPFVAMKDGALVDLGEVNTQPR